MRVLFLLAVMAAPAWAHPHEWVDWGVGLVLDEKKPVKAEALVLELTWDEGLSSLMLIDFPSIQAGTMKAADLSLLDTSYGLASPDRAVSLTVTFRGKPVAAKPVITAVRTDGKKVTLVYSITLGLSIDSPSEMQIEIYDPTYYTDMGIRSDNGAFFPGVKNPAEYQKAFKFIQDFDHAYYGGSVYPEAVVFALRP